VSGRREARLALLAQSPIDAAVAALPAAFVAAVVRVVISIVALFPFVPLHGPVAAVRAQAIAARRAGTGGRRITFLAGVAAAVATALLAAFFVTTVTRVDVAVVAFLLPHARTVAARRLSRFQVTLVVTPISRLDVAVVALLARGAPAVAADRCRTGFAACSRASALVSRTGFAERKELPSSILPAGEERCAHDGGSERAEFLERATPSH
jgi:hypothetical protein